MHELAYDLMKTDIVLSLIPGPRRTSGGFSPDEEKRPLKDNPLDCSYGFGGSLGIKANK
jgi:hypothetical protein